MTLQEIFYLVAIIFMSTVTIAVVILLVIMLDLYSRSVKILKSVNNFATDISASGSKILEQLEIIVAKIISAVSVGKIIHKIIEAEKKFKSKKN